MTPEMLTAIKDFISSIGFPILCVVFMWRKITDSDEKQTVLLTQLTAAIDKLSDLIHDGKDVNQ